MKTTTEIRRELKKLINKKKLSCSTVAEENNAVNEARAEINTKYGKGWREQDIPESSSKTTSPSFYEGHTHGEHWMD